MLLLIHLGPGCVGLQSTSPTKETAAAEDSGLAVGGFLVDRSAIDFGEVSLGMSSEELVTVTNQGDSSARMAAVYDGDGDIEISSTSLTIPAGGDSVLTVTFAPSFAGAYAGDLTLSPVDGTDPAVLPVAGVGVDPSDTGENGGSSNGGENGGNGGSGGDSGGGEGNLTVSPTTYDYGQVDLGDTTNTTFTIRNDGSADLLLSDIRITEAVFTHTGGTVSLPQVLSPGSSKTFQISFSPSAVRSYSGNVTLESDDPDDPNLGVAVSGEGADLCDICSPLIDVDTGGDPYSVTDFLSLLGSADSRTWFITNVGDEDLDVTDVYVNNDAFAPCGDFSVSGFSAATLRPGGSTRFNISYLSTEPCIEVPNPSFDMNVVHVLSNDPSQPDYVIELGGLGL